MPPFPHLDAGRIVNHRKILFVLVAALPVLLVAFSVSMGAYLLLQATGDAAGATVLRAVAIVLLLLGVVDFVLLVGALGAIAILPPPPTPDRPSDQPPRPPGS